MEAQELARFLQLVEENECGGESCVAAEVDFAGRGKPTEMESVIWLADKECRFGEVVLGRDRLENLIGQPFRQRTDGGGISSEYVFTERIDLEDGQIHLLMMTSGLLMMPRQAGYDAKGIS